MSNQLHILQTSGITCLLSIFITRDQGTATYYTRARVTRTRLYQNISYFEGTLRTKNHSINSMLNHPVTSN